MKIGHAVIRLVDKPVTLMCAGCDKPFHVHPEDERVIMDAGLVYCDDCNEEARLWCKRVEDGW